MCIFTTNAQILLFKHWDSDHKKKGRICFHTSFDDPNAPRDAPPRQSIEVRGLAFFPDHEPNTCPELLEKKRATTSEDRGVDAVAKKILNAVRFINFWPKQAQIWAKNEHARGVAGVKAIANRIVEDKQNHMGRC